MHWQIEGWRSLRRGRQKRAAADRKGKRYCMGNNAFVGIQFKKMMQMEWITEEIKHVSREVRELQCSRGSSLVFEFALTHLLSSRLNKIWDRGFCRAIQWDVGFPNGDPRKLLYIHLRWQVWDTLLWHKALWRGDPLELYFILTPDHFWAFVY